MRRSVGIWLLAALGLVPFVWIVATSSFTDAPVAAALTLLICLASYGLLLRGVLHAHRRGRFLPHTCLTCGSPMAAIDPGRLRPPAGAREGRLPRWRCRKCGRLV